MPDLRAEALALCDAVDAYNASPVLTPYAEMEAVIAAARALRARLVEPSENDPSAIKTLRLLEFGVYRGLGAREGLMCGICYRFAREGHADDCWLGKRMPHPTKPTAQVAAEVSAQVGDDWGDPGRCPTCRSSHVWVRPGKSQPTCDCQETCPVHGPHKIVYHALAEVAPNLSGYFCADCFAPQPEEVMPSAAEHDTAARLPVASGAVSAPAPAPSAATPAPVACAVRDWTPRDQAVYATVERITHPFIDLAFSEDAEDRERYAKLCADVRALTERAAPPVSDADVARRESNDGR